MPYYNRNPKKERRRWRELRRQNHGHLRICVYPRYNGKENGSYDNGLKVESLGFRDNGKENGSYHNRFYRDYIGLYKVYSGITENRNYYNGLYRAIYRGYIGTMEKNIETTIMGYIRFRV